MQTEQTIWKISPSQWTNFPNFVICFFLSITVALFPIAIIYGFYKFLDVKNCVYELTQERILTVEGILSRTHDELELYRVKDFRLSEPFYLRIVGLSDILLETSDRTHPLLKIPAVSNGRIKLSQIRDLVQQQRRRHGVREIDDVGR